MINIIINGNKSGVEEECKQECEKNHVERIPWNYDDDSYVEQLHVIKKE